MYGQLDQTPNSHMEMTTMITKQRKWSSEYVINKEKGIKGVCMSNT